ncbi:hypothetical protein [Kiloniella laminariae]|uniref:hypothetical protein n=1 Tax=Kiloniella laminariae TaxID=454162 RepID=UPI000399ED47|nr:hypothetical protein [Kiloniella laminariae]
MFGFIKTIFSGLGGLAGTAKAAASLLGAGASLYGGIQQNKQAKKQARQAREQAAFDAERKRIQTRRLSGQQRANFAAAGLKIEGSPALLIEETEQLGYQEADSILRYGDMQAKALKKQGRNALIGGGLSAGGGILGGIADNRLLKQTYPTLFGPQP